MRTRWAALVLCLGLTGTEAWADPVPGPVPPWTIEQNADPSALPAPTMPSREVHLRSVFVDRDGRTYLVGRSAELYEAVGPAEWRRINVGGVAGDVRRVFRSQAGALYAASTRAPLYKFDGTVWSVAPLVNKGPAAVSAGPYPVIAIRRHLYSLDSKGWSHQGTTPGPLRRMWASSLKKVYALTTKNTLMLRQNRFWRSMNLPLPPGDTIVDIAGVDGRIVVGRSARGELVQLSGKRPLKLKRAAELEHFDIHCMGSARGELWLAGVAGEGESATPVLARLERGKLVVAAPLWPLQAGDQFALLHETSDKRLLIATDRGQLRLQDADGLWSNGLVHGEAPDPGHPDTQAAPARSF